MSKTTVTFDITCSVSIRFDDRFEKEGWAGHTDEQLKTLIIDEIAPLALESNFDLEVGTKDASRFVGIYIESDSTSIDRDSMEVDEK